MWTTSVSTKVIHYHQLALNESYDKYHGILKLIAVSLKGKHMNYNSS